MNVTKIFRLALFFILFSSTIFLLRLGDSKDLVASLAQLPSLAESPDKGAFVDLVKAMDDVYTEGRIKIEVYPMARSVDNVITGKADFHIPVFVNPVVPVSKLPYRYISERIGTTSFILYSHKDKPITAKLVNDALAKGGNFPYKIETGHGIESSFGFPLLPTNSIEQSFRKVEVKRIDGFLWAQEEGDLILKNLKIKTIYRSHFVNFQDTLLIQKGPEGDKADKILSDVVKKLRKTGRLQKLFLKIHKPYEDWQPSQM